jgi:hypothetical protein
MEAMGGLAVSAHLHVLCAVKIQGVSFGFPKRARVLDNGDWRSASRAFHLGRYTTRVGHGLTLDAANAAAGERERTETGGAPKSNPCSYVVRDNGSRFPAQQTHPIIGATWTPREG